MLTGIFIEIEHEYQWAAKRFPPFHSAREGFDILDEEVQELKQAIRHGTKEQARAEAIQVAAMALRFIIDLYETPEFNETLTAGRQKGE